MTPERFQSLAGRYGGLRVAVVGDFCLDRYLEIDPALAETSIETGLTVHNVVRVRSQPGGAGTILNNLVALGVGKVVAVGFAGDDGEGYELRRALAALPGVDLGHFATAAGRATFTYAKPLVVEPGRPPVELSRLDRKNWTPTPPDLSARFEASLRAVADRADAVVVMDQVDLAGTGVVTPGLLGVLGAIAADRPGLPVLADSRGGLRHWPPALFKMNGAELAALLGGGEAATLAEVGAAAAGLAARNGRPVFVTLSERGIVVAAPGGEVDHVPALPVRGPIDIVGAGDAVTANLAAALAAGATPREAAEIAVLAASLVIHQLGTTGAATVPELAGLLRVRPG